MNMMTPKSKIIHKKQDMHLRFKENLIAIFVIISISLWVVLMAS
jgi:hypothetical protein